MQKPNKLPLVDRVIDMYNNPPNYSSFRSQHTSPTTGLDPRVNLCMPGGTAASECGAVEDDSRGHTIINLTKQGTCLKNPKQGERCSYIRYGLYCGSLEAQMAAKEALR